MLSFTSRAGLKARILALHKLQKFRHLSLCKLNSKHLCAPRAPSRRASPWPQNLFPDVPSPPAPPLLSCPNRCASARGPRPLDVPPPRTSHRSPSHWGAGRSLGPVTCTGDGHSLRVWRTSLQAGITHLQASILSRVVAPAGLRLRETKVSLSQRTGPWCGFRRKSLPQGPASGTAEHQSQEHSYYGTWCVPR